jgi:secondary thiamine-phosphate synthase enzyme
MVSTHTLRVKTRGHTDILNLTDEVARLVRDSAIANGIVNVFVPGSTAALTTVEYEDGLIADLRALFERLAPERADYQHNARWHDGNGYAHVRSAFVGPSLAIPFVKHEMLLGTWQQIVLVDFDNRARTREVIVQIVGD